VTKLHLASQSHTRKRRLPSRAGTEQRERTPPRGFEPPTFRSASPRPTIYTCFLLGVRSVREALQHNLINVGNASSEKHSLQVASQEEGSQPTVRDMALLIEQVTGVPISFQKLIYKGKSLKEMEQPLATFGVKNGCKVMLIGKRNSPEEETELKKLKDLEKSVEQIAKKIEDVNKELGGIQKGFLAKNLQTEALNQLDKRIKGTAEQFMKILEQIDAIMVPELWKGGRNKRLSKLCR
uniref:BAG family molecular chaperone regulator 1 n=1 Tax=Podarcis muralis TaxID=64176 RepID=A0A670JN52_PODMU